MKTRTILLIFLSLIILMILLVMGFRFLLSYIENKFGDNVLIIVCIILVAVLLIYGTREEIQNRRKLKIKWNQYLDLGKLLFKQYIVEFEIFYNSQKQVGKGARSKNSEPIEILERFADKKGLSLLIDWRGEENEGEVEAFITTQIEEKISWTNTLKLKEANTGDQSEDGTFIIKLFKAIDKDLKPLNKKLLFFDLGSDSYVFTVTDIITYKKITKMEGSDFHGTGKLKA